LAKEHLHLFYLAGAAATVAALCLIALAKVRASPIGLSGEPSTGRP